MSVHDAFLPEPELTLGHYRHYKGGEYEVLMLACNEETHEWLVVYKALYDTKGAPAVWVRTYENFTEQVMTERGAVPRFHLVSE